MNNDNVVETPGPAEDLSAVQRIFAVFTSPKRAFESVAQNPTWLLPLIIIVVTSVIFIVFAQQVIITEAIQKQETKLLEQGLDQEQIDRALAMAGTVMKITIPIMGVIAPPVLILLISAVLLFVGNVILGGSAKFKQVFAVTCHSWLIFTVSSLLLLPLVLARQTMDVTFSLALLMPDAEKTGFIYQLLSKVDLFWIWWIAVQSIGLAVIYKVRTQKIAITLTIIYAIYALVAAGLSSAFA
jgi:hypothetical protein